MNASGSPHFGNPVVGLGAGFTFVLGVGLTLVAIFADDLGIGGGSGFGYVQLIGLITGIVLILIGAAVPLQKLIGSRGRDSFEPER